MTNKTEHIAYKLNASIEASTPSILVNSEMQISEFVYFKQALVRMKLAKNGKLSQLLTEFSSHLINSKTIEVKFKCTSKVFGIFDDYMHIPL